MEGYTYDTSFGLATIPTASGSGTTGPTGTIVGNTSKGPTDYFTGLFGNILSSAANVFLNKETAKQQLDYEKAKAAQQQQQAGMINQNVMQTGLIIVAVLAAVVALIMIYRTFVK